jgi:hypothetical protein
MMNMSLFDSMRELSNMFPEQESQQEQQLYYDPTQFANEFNAYRAEPTLFPNATQYVSPFMEDNWGGVTGIIASLDEASRSPGAIIENRIDPNKIYTSELAALRTSAADQVRITKLFEKKLMEGLKDKDKFGLNENDILAMQALTAARSAVTGINKEMINIKKNISELRLKQQQNAVRQQTGGDPGVMPTTPGSMEMGHASLDDLFNSTAATAMTANASGYDAQASPEDINRAIQTLDDVIDVNGLNKYTKYETENPTTVVLIGDTDDDVEYATYNENGDLMMDYPNPISDIVEINREAGYAKDSLLRTYELRKK